MAERGFAGSVGRNLPLLRCKSILVEYIGKYPYPTQLHEQLLRVGGFNDTK